jgi:hypothetical protein
MLAPAALFLLSLLDLAQVSETVVVLMPLLKLLVPVTVMATRAVFLTLVTVEMVILLRILSPLLSSLLLAVVLTAPALLPALLFPPLLLDPVKASETARPLPPELVLVTATTTLLMPPKPLPRHLAAAVALCLLMVWLLPAALSLHLLLDLVTASVRVATPLLPLGLAMATATVTTTLPTPLRPPLRRLAAAAELCLPMVWPLPVVLFLLLLLDPAMASARVAMPLLHLDLDWAAVTMTPTMLPRLQVAAAAEETSPAACFSPDAEARLIPTFPLLLPALVKASVAGARAAASKGALVALPKSFMYN